MMLREAKVVYASRRVVGSRKMQTADDVNRVLVEYGLPDHTQEHFVVVHVNTRHDVLSVQTVAMGSLGSVYVHPREVFRAAVMVGAAAVFLAHNHPSGDCEPSKDDLELTNRLKSVGEMLGIPVLDHLVVSGGDYVSLMEKGLM